MINKLRGTLQVAAVKAPGYGDRRKAMLEDIAVLTGGTAVMEELGIDLEKMPVTDLGRAKKITINKDTTTIVEGAGAACGALSVDPSTGSTRGRTLVGARARCLMGKGRWAVAKVAAFDAASGRHLVRLDSNKAACELTLPDHTVDLEVDAYYGMAWADDEAHPRGPTHEQTEDGRSVKLFVSSASICGYRHVRPAASPCGTLRKGAERRARKTEALKAKAFRCSEVGLQGRWRNPTVL
mgnify:CR=1 FL=1